MKAARYSGHGGPEVIRYEDVPEPTIAPADVIVKVAACAINRLDLIQRIGHFTLPGYRLPHIAGMDVAGEIVEIGRQVEGVSVGDRVVINPSLTAVRGDSRFAGLDDRYGELGVIGATVDGGYAELCAAPASHVQPIPEGFTYEEVACIPTCYVTAWHALSETGRLAAGETVLIHAAGGGVSSAAIQLARKFGATVLATARTEAKLEHARRLGAHHVLCHHGADVARWAHEVTDGRGVDMVFDHIGPALWHASLAALRPRGRLITCGATTGPEVTLELGRVHQMGLRIIGSDSYSYQEFERVLNLYWQGGFQQTIDSVFPLAEAGNAQRRMDSLDFTGKILLKP
ncbi:MAG TPA: zinc-binding dehydrogenase [Steroidobacteraceae bacterium]|nr:zinc-binding dehydrogenase [Steroidobacteraceae bacterium]